MLDEFILAHRDEIIRRTRARVAERLTPKASDAELTNGIPVFLDQLCDALLLAKSSDEIDHARISQSAARHGHDLLRMGLTIAQVVHDYGDICQTITGLALEQQLRVSADEFKTLNLCLDDAIAGAVTEFSRQREHDLAAAGTERLGILAHELRNLLNVATLSFEAIASGHVPARGSTGLMHSRSLMGLRDLVDRSLTEVRLDVGIERLEQIPVAQFIEEVEIGAVMLAQAHNVQLAVAPVDPILLIEGDRQILAATLSNLLQNAFKFTGKQGHVSLTTHATAERVLFDIEDECGGLPPGQHENMFRPFDQQGQNRTGVGLGLAISVRAAKAHGGEIRVRDLPGKGCIFTLDLPRKPPPPLSVVRGGLSGPGAGAAPGAAGSGPKLSRAM